MQRPALEVADIFRSLDPSFLKRYPAIHRRVVGAITACRTARLGGHVDACDACGHRVISYNSCRNRHCPKCEGSATAAWLDAQRVHLLPVPYSHVVFTLPQQLAPLALQNPRVIYGLLFQAVAKTLLQIAADSRHLGARIGFLCILHTWGQTLCHHPHLHCLIPAGGLSPDGSRWIACHSRFFLPVRVLSRLFRGKFLSLLQRAFDHGRIEFHGQLQPLSDPQRFASLSRETRCRDWVVYAKPPMSGPDAVLKYLARYTHRVAISNHRLQAFEHGQVTFQWKDYAHGHRVQSMTLAAAEFARRFLLHVLPRRFVRIRCYGFLANAQRQRQLALCRTLCAPAPSPPVEPTSVANEASSDVVCENQRCPRCRTGRLSCIEIIPPDTS